MFSVSSSEMASVMRSEKTPSMPSVLLGLTQKDGTRELAGMLSQDRIATLVHSGLKQRKTDAAAASDRSHGKLCPPRSSMDH